MIRKRTPPPLNPAGKPIRILKQNPVARELMKKTYHEQVKPSKKVYHRKKERRASRRLQRDL